MNILEVEAILQPQEEGGGVHKSNVKVLFICLLNYLLTDNKGGIYVAIKTSVPEWYWASTEDHFMDWVQ